MPLTKGQARQRQIARGSGKAPRKRLEARPRNDLRTEIDYTAELYKIECKEFANVFAYVKEDEIRFYLQKDFWTPISTYCKGADGWDEMSAFVEENGRKCHPSVTFEE
jgi:hypothetical protein